jgi:ankyrin repeat protein
VLKALLDQKADPNVRDELKGNFILRNAALKGEVEIATLLIQYGARQERDDLVIAQRVRASREKDQKQRQLDAAVVCGHLQRVEEAIQAGAEVDLGDPTPPLVEAAKRGNLEIVRFLVTQGRANVEIGEKSTPLMQAAKAGHLDIVQFLLTEGKADPNKNSLEGTALHQAIREGQADVVRLLVKTPGIKLEEQDRSRLTTLEAARKCVVLRGVDAQEILRIVEEALERKKRNLMPKPLSDTMHSLFL